MTDTDIVNWLADNHIIEGLAGVEMDIHEIATDISFLAGDDSGKPDYRKAFRLLIERAAEQTN